LIISAIGLAETFLRMIPLTGRGWAGLIVALLPSYPNNEQVNPVTRPGKMRIRDEFRMSNFGCGRE
jgi:hypothetical protein